MDWIATGLRRGRVVLLTTISLFPAIAQGASDGSVEESYARKCGKHQSTPLCNALREAMTGQEPLKRAEALQAEADKAEVSEAVQAAIAGVPGDVPPFTPVASAHSKVWGPIADYVGTYWVTDDGLVGTYRVVDPGNSYEWRSYGMDGESVYTFERSPQGRIIGIVKGEVPEVGKSYLVSASGFSYTLEYLGESGSNRIDISPEMRKNTRVSFVDGKWKVVGRFQSRRITEAQFNAAVEALRQIRERVTRQPRLPVSESVHAAMQEVIGVNQPIGEPSKRYEGWGLLNVLAGTAWWNPKLETSYAFEWQETGETLRQWDINSVSRGYHEFKRDISGQTVHHHNGGIVETIAPDAVRVTNAGQGRTTYRLTENDTLLSQRDVYRDGAWQSGPLLEFQRISTAQYVAAGLALRPYQRAAAIKKANEKSRKALENLKEKEQAELAARKEEERARAGRYHILTYSSPVVGQTSEFDRGSGFIWRVACFKIDAKKGDPVRIATRVFGERAGLFLNDSCSADDGHFTGSDNQGHRGDLELTYVQGSGTRYALLWLRGKNKRYEVRARRLSVAEYRQWEENKRQAEAARAAARSNDSGLLGAIMAGAGAVMAGGNAEQVMGMAMKGAEMTTDNAVTRNVLAGQGDAFIASGTNRMIQDSARRAAPSSAASAVQPRSQTGTAAAMLAGGGRAADGSGGTMVRVILHTGLNPGPNNTRNPMCFSEYITLPEKIDTAKPGASARIDTLVAGYYPVFIRECSRFGVVTSPGNRGYSASHNPGFEIMARQKDQHHAEDVHVTVQ